MTRIANDTSREYRSALRAEQAEATRARILDATIRVIAGGLAYVSIPAVAREAGVSVPTVYRHFATKRDLLAAVYPHSVRGSGLAELARPRSMDELLGGLRTYFERTDSLGDLARVAMASPAVGGGAGAQHAGTACDVPSHRRFNRPEAVAGRS